MTNVNAFKARIAKAQTDADFDKLDTSLERLYNNGIFTASELGALDVILMEARVALLEK